MDFDPKNKVVKKFQVLITMKQCKAFPDGKIFRGIKEHYSKEKLEEEYQKYFKTWEHGENVRGLIIVEVE